MLNETFDAHGGWLVKQYFNSCYVMMIIGILGQNKTALIRVKR